MRLACLILQILELLSGKSYQFILLYNSIIFKNIIFNMICLKNHCSNPLIEDCTQVIAGNTHDS